MEGISIGEDGGSWYVGLNFKIRSPDSVAGWHYHDYDCSYRLVDDMVLLDEETRLSPKCLIKW